MRSLPELQQLCRDAGLKVSGAEKRVELMDMLRNATGDFDPSHQIDPAKAQDLKDKIDWSAYARGDVAAAFAGISKHLTGEWVAEPKLDGARIRIFLGLDRNTMNTGRRSTSSYAYIERADNFPHLRDCVIPGWAGTVIDGELMSPSRNIPTQKQGETTNSWLNAAMALINVNPEAAVRTQAQVGRAIFMAFDVMTVQGEDVTHYPLHQRRQLLEHVVGELYSRCPQFQIIAQFEATAENIDTFLREGFEGAMLKQKTSKYLAGKRMSSWQKVKRMSTGDFFITGSNDGKNSNAGLVGSLRVAYKDDLGLDVECADVGGFDQALRRELTNIDTGKVKSEYIGKVIEVMGQGRTGKNQRIRHPHFVRFRDDKTPEDCDRFQLELFEEV